jgi:two-component system, LytTR family, sensor kinase
MIWRSWKFWLIVVAAATCIGVIEGAQVYAGASSFGRPIPWSLALGSTMPSWYVMAALLPGVLWVSHRFPLEPGRWRRSLLVHVPAAVAFAIVHITVASWLSDYVFYTGGEPPWSFRMNLSRLLTLYFVIELVTYSALVGVYHAYDYARRYRERERAAAQLELKTSRLEASLARANLDALRLQLSPHFLFNTLNAISVMAMKGERDGVVRMLSQLSDLLRLTLERQQQVVSLRAELQFLDRYLEIEQVRFRDRLTIERDIEPEALDAGVPSLLLQPLAENAIQHGISRRPGPGTVRIEARIVEGDTVELRVLDTGVGLDEALRREGMGVGMANTRARLEQLYWSDQSLELCNRPVGGACVTVRLPLRLVAPEPAGAVRSA